MTFYFPHFQGNYDTFQVWPVHTPQPTHLKAHRTCQISSFPSNCPFKDHKLSSNSTTTEHVMSKTDVLLICVCVCFLVVTIYNHCCLLLESRLLLTWGLNGLKELHVCMCAHSSNNTQNIQCLIWTNPTLQDRKRSRRQKWRGKRERGRTRSNLRDNKDEDWRGRERLMFIMLHYYVQITS